MLTSQTHIEYPLCAGTVLGVWETFMNKTKISLPQKAGILMG